MVVTTPSAVTFSRSHVIFGAAKSGSSGRPVMRASSPARLLRRSQMAAERRSCQTIALLSGFPVALSQASTVSPWLAMPGGQRRERQGRGLGVRDRAGLGGQLPGRNDDVLGGRAVPVELDQAKDLIADADAGYAVS